MHRITVFFTFAFLLSTALHTQAPDTKNSIADDHIISILDSTGHMYDANEFRKAAEYMEQVDPALISSDSLALEYTYRIMILYGHLEEHDKLFETTIKGLIQAHEQKDRWMLLSFYRSMGSFHIYVLEDYDKGIEYLKEAMLYLDAVDEYSQCGLMMEIGAASLEAEQVDSAKIYYDRAFDYLPKVDSVMDHDVYSFYIPYLLKTNQLDTAEHYIEMTNEFWDNYGFKEGYMASYLSWAELKLRTEEFEEALLYATKVKGLAEELENPFTLLEALEFKSRAEEELDLKEESLASYRELKNTQDYIDELRAEQKLENKRIEFISRRYEQELNDVKIENSILDKRYTRNQRLVYISIVLLLLLSLLYWGMLKRRKARIEALDERLKKSRLHQESLKKEYDETVGQLERKLTSISLFLEKKNEALRSIRKLLSGVPDNSSEEILASVQSAHKLAETSLRNTENWESFLYFFESVYPSFIDEVVSSYPHLNQNDIRIFSFIKMGLTDKEAARLQSISTASFQKAKYRLKKKLNAPKELLLNDIVANL